MKIKNILIAALAGSLLTGCGLYDKYEQKVEAPSGIYGNGADGQALYTATGDSASVAQVSWRDIFTDPLLQQLIEQVLANNTDLNSARIAIEKSEAALKAAKLAYLPSLFSLPSPRFTTCRCSCLGMLTCLALSPTRSVRQRPYSCSLS